MVHHGLTMVMNVKHKTKLTIVVVPNWPCLTMASIMDWLWCHLPTMVNHVLPWTTMDWLWCHLPTMVSHVLTMINHGPTMAASSTNYGQVCFTMNNHGLSMVPSTNNGQPWPFTIVNHRLTMVPSTNMVSHILPWTTMDWLWWHLPTMVSHVLP